MKSLGACAWWLVAGVASVSACEEPLPSEVKDLPDVGKDAPPPLLVCPTGAAPVHNSACEGTSDAWCTYEPACACGVCAPTYRCECRVHHWQCEVVAADLPETCAGEDASDGTSADVPDAAVEAGDAAGGDAGPDVADGGSACATPSPAGCLSTGAPCPTGTFCSANALWGCAPTSCVCDVKTGAWGCTSDCGGGVCVDSCQIADPPTYACCAGNTAVDPVCKLGAWSCPPKSVTHAEGGCGTFTSQPESGTWCGLAGVCAQGQVCCGGGDPACVSATSACAASATCDGPEDCPGEVCCFRPTALGSGLNTSSCVASAACTALSGHPACNTTKDCAGAGQCCAIGSNGGVLEAGVCRANCDF